MYTEHVDHSACSPHCRISLHMSEDQKGFDAMLMAYRNNTLLEAKSFHFSECVKSNPEICCRVPEMFFVKSDVCLHSSSVPVLL